MPESEKIKDVGAGGEEETFKCFLCHEPTESYYEAFKVDAHTCLVMLSTHEDTERLEQVKEKSGLTTMTKVGICQECATFTENEVGVVNEVEDEPEPVAPLAPGVVG